MRVLITGGAGFLGAHVARALCAAQVQVSIIDDLSASSFAHVEPHVAFIKADVRTPLVDLFRACRPEIVVHLAAQISVSRSIEEPEIDLTANVLGTVNVMEAAARAGVRKVVALSSAAVYGLPQSIPLTEESPTAPVSPYGLSKLTAEHYIQLLGELRGVPFTILRPSNLYGPRQSIQGDGAVVPAFLQRFLAGQDPVLHGDGTQVRDFLYVGDMVRAILQACTRGDGLTLNISSGVGTSILALWQALAALLGWQRPPIFGAPRPGDITHSVMANALAQSVLGWAPAVALQRGLAMTVAYHQQSEAAAARER